MKYNLKQATFLIPVRIDCDERLENLLTIISFLKNNFDTNILVGEESSKPILENKIPDVQYFYLQSDGFEFYRTKLLNKLINITKTPVIVNHDCDTIVSIDNYIKAYKMIIENKEDFVWPYDGRFIVIARNYLQQIKTGNFSFDKITGRQINHDSKGGIIFYNRIKFIEAGMENEKFISWSRDDEERFHRVCKLGYRIKRLVGHLVHIDHPRGINSGKTNPFYESSNQELEKIYNMNCEQLKLYTKSWTYDNSKN
jgi:hypothetical protein